MHRPSPPIPLAAWLLGVPGCACLAGGALLLAEVLPVTHPLLTEPGSALALIVSGVALVGSAGFPLVLARLAARDAQ